MVNQKLYIINLSNFYDIISELKEHIDYELFKFDNKEIFFDKAKGKNLIFLSNNKKGIFDSNFDASIKRVKKTNFIKDEYLDVITNSKSKPRIPFGSLIELGAIKPGTEIYDQKKKIYAKVMVDGSIKHAQTEGSIHKVAATILGAESCNGWTFWHINRSGRLIPIDHLRNTIKLTA